MSTSAPKDLQEATATTSSATDVNRTPIASDENLACQWERCSERCVSAEALFEHICEKHVGRKSTNNLNLTCGWASCRTTTVKRDHITSHIRVHVPLKPHKCDFCGKAFKRPQDLKKHVKTHADDSVLLRSPEADGRINSRGISKVIDALHYRGASSAFYDQGVTMPGGHAPFGNVHQSAQNGFYAQQQPAQYGPVYYPNSHGSDNTHHNSYDNRKRGYETLNEFFGDAKRRQIDPTSYTQVGQRLMALHGLPMNQGGMSDYMPTSSPLVSIVNQNGGNQGSIPQHQYALPLPNLRTKNDLMNIDQFLEQMQSTVYESSNAAAAAGVHQPGAHYTHAGVNFRQSQSPPHTNINHLGQMNGNVSSPHSTSMMSSHPSTQSNTTSTPALTPSSSTLSYTSGHSPVSSHDMSPVARNSTITSSSYPNLPSVSLGYQSHSIATPTSALGPNFENDLRRRYSGGMLQSSKPGVREELNTVDDSPTSTSVDKIDGVSHANNIDPALSEVGSPIEQSDSDDSARDRAEETWIENIRVIEALRMMVSDRLRRKEYEIDDVPMTGVLQKLSENEERKTEILYPTLRVSDD